MNREPIAIIGIGCRFPGGAKGPEAFWQLLTEGRDAISEIPPDRWNIATHYDPQPGRVGKSISKWGGFVDEIDRFDPALFGISPREAAFLDPQQRLLLETTWEALEDAGEPASRLRGSATGVFIGISTHDYELLQTSPDERSEIDIYSTTGGTLSIAANRVSYCFDLRGPSLSIDTACSSSLVALHLASESLARGDCERALVGGVNALLAPMPFIAFSRMSMLSPTGRCRAFDIGADGFVRGEGAGLIVLKPLSRALHDGDRIYALVRGTAVNQDGRTNGITVPSSAAQAALVRQACQEAGVKPTDITYVEAHGTGTPVGDPIEASALAEALTGRGVKRRPLVIGSAKTNVGHLEAAAGVTGIIKLALTLRHGVIPANLHFREPNPNIDFERWNLRVPTEAEELPTHRGEPALAGVNSFGFGGTNGHAILQAWPRPKHTSARKKSTPKQARLLVVSAQNQAALTATAERHATMLGKEPAEGETLDAVCRTAGERREHHEHRLAVVGMERGELAQSLMAFTAGEAAPGVVTGHPVAGSDSGVVFNFSGQGTQWWGMGRELLREEPVFKSAITEIDAILSPVADWCLIDELSRNESRSRLAETAIAQPAIFALQVALVRLLGSWGVKPAAVVGHSVGEVAAAHVAGILSLRDATHVIFQRGRCMDLAPERGRMLAAEMSPEEAAAMIAPVADRVAVGAINAPRSVTLSGDEKTLEAIARDLEARETLCRFVPVGYAFHSPQMDPVKPELLRSLGRFELANAQIPLFSTVTGGRIRGEDLDGTYWWRNVRETVQFAPAIDSLVARGFRVFLEVSAHPALSGSVSQCLRQRSAIGAVVPTLRRREPERANLLRALGTLHTAGIELDWKTLNPDISEPARLPTYPWQKERHWHESGRGRERRLNPPIHAFLGHNTHRAEPTWETWLDRQAMPWIDDHRVQGRTLFPAAGFLEVALEAADQTLDTRSCVVENIDFLRPLTLANEGEAPRVEVKVEQASGRFSISSATPGATDEWTVHTTGQIRSTNPWETPPRLSLRDLRQRIADPVDVLKCYERFRNVGLEFGPAFRGIKRLWNTDGEALGRICLTSEVTDDVDRYQIQPALLDACFQVLSAALPDPPAGESAPLYLPVHIDRFQLRGTPTGPLWSHTRLVQQAGGSIVGNLRVTDDRGQVWIEVDGFRCQAVVHGKLEDESDPGRWLYKSIWQEQPLPGAAPQVRRADFLSKPAVIAREIRRILRKRQRGKQSGRSRFLRIEPGVDTLCRRYIALALSNLGWEPRVGEQVIAEQLAAKLRVARSQRKAFERLLVALEGDQRLVRNESGWTVRRLLPSGDVNQMWQKLLAKLPGFHAELTLLRRTGIVLADILRGKVDALAAIAPGGSLTTLEHFYQNAPSAVDYNAAFAEAVATAAAGKPEGHSLRILEIGAGTGGTTAHVLPRLPDRGIDYLFTDVSAAFFPAAEKKFFDQPALHTQSLDIERSAEAQSFEPHSFDLILASDALHATTNLRKSLSNVRSLLAADGILLLLEIDRPTLWIDLVFGLTPGWWRFRDRTWRTLSPLLNTEDWERVLRASGFVDIAVTCDAIAPKRSGQSILVARGPTVDAPATSPAVPKPAKSDPRHWLLFADTGGVAENLAEELRKAGHQATLVFSRGSGPLSKIDSLEADLESPEDIDQLLGSFVTPPTGIVHLAGLDGVKTAEITSETLRQSEEVSCHSTLRIVQALARRESEDSQQLILVTRAAHSVGSGSVNPAQAPLWGLGRVIQNERRRLNCRLIDLDPAQNTLEGPLLVAEILSDDGEEEVAWRSGIRYTNRLVRTTLEAVPYGAEKERWRLEIPAPGTLNQLERRPQTRHAVGSGEVEIEVHAAALNFRDVMKTIGIYPIESDRDLQIGDECTGRVIAIGQGVTSVRPGDEVLAMDAGCFASHVTVPERVVARIPKGLSLEEAVTIPVAFLTSWYALHHLGKIRAGESILIHAATGGVGLSAIQIAHLAGARIFATAGSEEKREFLRALGVEHPLDSRTLDFADEVRTATGGRGVDLVLNSLAGPAIGKSLESLAPHGRFLEIGKRDIYQDSRVGLRPFRHGLSFFAIDMQQVMKDHPEMVRALMASFLDHFRSGKLRPLPHRIFPVSESNQAFRLMAKAEHIGKIVLKMNDELGLQNASARASTPGIRRDGSYLVTGGLGGFGLALAEWMVEQGAGHIILAGRSGATTNEARQTIARLRRRGTRVTIAKVDVTQKEAVNKLCRGIASKGPPLRGVVHAAMVLDDGLMTELNAARFRRVMEPKVTGAWNLHRATEGVSLDFFVLFSSVSAIVGAPAQANYVAANAFLDALAHHRRQLGMPALTINWGGISKVGYVARNERVEEHLTRQGVLAIPPKAALDIFGQILGSDWTQLGVVRVDWQRWANFLPAVATTPRFSELFETTGEAPETTGSAQAMILEASPEEQRARTGTYLKEQVARVLRTPVSGIDVNRSLPELGVDSLMAFELVNQLESQLRISFPPSKLAGGATIEQITDVLLELISNSTGNGTSQSKEETFTPDLPVERWVTLNSAGQRAPLICIHPAGGLGSLYRDLAAALPADLPVYALQSRAIREGGAEHATLAALAREYATCIVKRWPSDPIRLLGFSIGGIFALATAAELEERGVEVSFVAVIDADLNLTDSQNRTEAYIRRHVIDMYRTFARSVGIVGISDDARLASEASELAQRVVQTGGGARSDEIVDWLEEKGGIAAEIPNTLIRQYFDLFDSHVALVEGAELRAVNAPIHLWRSTLQEAEVPKTKHTWKRIAAGGMSETRLKGSHYELLFPPRVQNIARAIADELRKGETG